MIPVPTPRLLTLCLAGLVAVALSRGFAVGLGVGLVWVAVVVVLGLVDAYLVLPDPAATWSRHHDDKLSLGAWNQVTLALHNGTRRRAVLRVRDAVPHLMVGSGESGQGVCGPAASWSLTYRVLPLHRGRFEFGSPGVRFLGPLGLVWLEHSPAISDSVEVYPDLLAVRNYEALLQRGHEDRIGLRPSRRWGEGSEFDRLREYLPDDEFRRINWKATARRHALTTVDYRVERSQTIILALDAGRLMSTRVPLPGIEPVLDPADHDHDAPPSSPLALSRLDYAVNASTLLAYVAQQYGDQVGVVTFTDRVRSALRPAPGRRQFFSIIRLLYALQDEQIESRYPTALARAASLSSKRALIVIFTDVSERESAESLIGGLAHVARTHLTLVVTMRDPGIERLATEEPSNLDAIYRRAVASDLLAHRDDTVARLRHRGVLTLDVAADALSSDVINTYLRVKARSEL